MELKRNYEVSIWTLQDSFITVLKPSELERVGMIENKTFEINTGNDINKYDFSIPMYIRSNGVKIKNPIWRNTINGDIITNMRKIKVILNKMTEVEKVYEFLIVNVSERHEKDMLYCDISCEDMAYHELGKIGYKISLSEQDLLLDTDEWFENNGSAASEPHGTIQYWNDKFLTNLDSVSTTDANIWYYTVQMDWSSYENGSNRLTNKVYEESFVSAWNSVNNVLVPSRVEYYKEKERLVQIEESNIFNVTQKIAEVFGVFCKYQYLYDSNYHIIGRRIIYFNNFIKETDGYLDITYPYSMEKVTRTHDGHDITTKMFVQNVSSEATGSGVLTIMDVEANKSQEDYILNFDYMRQVGSISDEQYAKIATYENQMHVYNSRAKILEEMLDVLSENLISARASFANASAAVPLDKDELSKANDLLNSLDIKDGTEDGTISRDDTNPVVGILIRDLKSSNNTYYINITEQGIFPETIRVYENFTIGTNPPLSGRIPFTVEYDEFNNVTKLINIPSSFAATKSIVYMTYNYRPKLQYDKIIEVWTKKLAQDQAKEKYYSDKVDSLTARITNYTNEYNYLLTSKKEAQKEFEALMGAALRESYWQPDDTYQDCGEKYVDNYNFSMTTNGVSYGSSGQSEMFWDTEVFDGEQKITYELGVAQEINNYPCIILSDKFLRSFANKLDKISFMYYDYTATEDFPHTINTIRNYPVGSQCQLGFAKISNTIYPILILTFASKLSSEQISMMYDSENSPQIGIFTAENINNGINTIIEDGVLVTSSDWLSNAAVAVYPRIKVNSLSIFKNSDNLSVKRNGLILKQYEDYYLLTRVDGNTYITLKPNLLIQTNTTTNSISCFFTLSNANTAIYLDALEILKENAYPKVSYSISPSVFSGKFFYDIYNCINRIVNINDVELKLENVQGYISKVTLDLDKPQNDKLEIKNYKNKFDDLFSNIVAQTQAIQKSSYTLTMASRGFTSTGAISPSVLQRSMLKADLDYHFNDGTLTINEEEGIWGTSESGVVAFRGGGIFTATQKDEVGNWIWNTGIIPQGINADLITAGQLDTNKILVYAGDKLRFQLNGDGLFAYKSFFEDLDVLQAATFDAPTVAQVNAKLAEGKDIDSAQFVRMDANGLALIVKRNALVLNKDHTGYITIQNNAPKLDALGSPFKVVDQLNRRVYYADGRFSYDVNMAEPWVYDENGDFILDENAVLSQQYYGTYTVPEEGIKRVSISWDGLSLKNYNNEQVFYADADTGNLYLKGRIYEEDTFVSLPDEKLIPLPNYVANIADKRLALSNKLKELFDKAGEILIAAGTSLNDLNAVVMEDFEILESFKENVAEKLVPKVTRGPYHTTKFKPGDIWEKAASTNASDSEVEGIYVATVYWDEVYADETAASTTSARSSEKGWTRTADYSLAAIKGANLKVDAEAGTVDILAQKAITLNAAGQINLGANQDVNIIGNENVNLGGAKINITSVDTTRDHMGGIHLSATKYDGTGVSGGSSVVDINADGIEMASKEGINIKSGAGIMIKSADAADVAVVELNKDKGLWLGSSRGIHIFSGATDAAGQTTSGADVVLDKDRLMFGVVNVTSGTGTAVDITDEYFIVASSNNIAGLQASDISVANNLTGLKLTKDGFGYATNVGSMRNSVLINDEGVQISSIDRSDTNIGTHISIAPDRLELGSGANLSVTTNNVTIDTEATGTDKIFAIGSGNNYYLSYDLANGFKTGGWTVDATKLYSSSVGMDSSSTYAIWAGSTNGASTSPFSVQRDGTVTLTKLLALDENGTTTEVNLRQYPFWKLNQVNVKNASVSDDGKTLTIERFTGGNVTFNKANAYSYSLVDYDPIESPKGGRVSIGIYDESDTLLSTAYVTLTSNNNTHSVGVMATADGGDHSDSGTIDLSKWYNDGWNNAVSDIIRPSASTGESFAFTLPNTTVDGDPVTYTYTMTKGIPSASGGYAAVSNGNAAIARIDISDWYTAGYEQGLIDGSSAGTITGAWNTGTNTYNVSRDGTVILSTGVSATAGGQAAPKTGTLDTFNSSHHMGIIVSGDGAGSYLYSWEVDATSEYDLGKSDLRSTITGSWSGVNYIVTADGTSVSGAGTSVSRSYSGATVSFNNGSGNAIFSDTINLSHSPTALDGFSNHQHRISLSWNNSQPFTTIIIDGTTEYNQGYDDGEASVSVSLYGAAYNRYNAASQEIVADAFYVLTNGDEGDKEIVIDASDAYSAGASSVTLSGSGWSGGAYTVTASNNKIHSVPLPSVVKGVSRYSNGEYTINLTVGGLSQATTITQSGDLAYNAGWGAAVGGRSGNVVTYATSTVGTTATETASAATTASYYVPASAAQAVGLPSGGYYTSTSDMYVKWS